MITPIFQTLKNIFRKPATVQYPTEKPKLPERFHGEPVTDWEKCVGCSLCARICPNSTIEMVDFNKSGEPFNITKHRRPRINLERCIMCAFCEEVCPVKAMTISKNFELAKSHRKDFIKQPREGQIY